MTITKIMWIICGVVYAVLILCVICIVAYNRIRNRKGKDED